MNAVIQEFAGILLITPHEYFDDEVARSLQEDLKPLLQGGRNRLVLDLEQCPLVSSPGVAYILDLAIKVREDCRGCLVLCSLTPLMLEVFTMVGVTLTAEIASSRKEAMELAAGFQPGGVT